MRLITVQTSFEAAHRIQNHNGKCAQLHGHSYLVEVTLGSRTLDAQSHMVLDFGMVKRAVKEYADNYWDHVTLLEESDYLVGRLTAPEGDELSMQKVLITRGPPTAERICEEWWEYLETVVLGSAPPRIVLIEVGIREGLTSWARKKALL